MVGAAGVCDRKVAMWGGSYAGFDQWATAKELPPHLATIVPAAAAHPPLDYPSFNDVGMLRHAMVHSHQWARRPKQSFRRSKVLAHEIPRGLQKHIAFKSLDSFVGNPSANFQRILKHPMADAY